MIKFENTEVLGWEHAIRGMRNPMNSWEKSDSEYDVDWTDDSVWPHESGRDDVVIGPNDLDLMTRLRNAGTDHRKFMRMIVVYVDVIGPLYWWKEMDQYRIGQTTNSCSTMHKIHAKEFTRSDFSYEHLVEDVDTYNDGVTAITETVDWRQALDDVIYMLNEARDRYLKTKDKKYWWQMIQLLPTSYNQKRTVMLNYEVLANIYKSRRNHKLDEWHTFCDWIESLPYSELIIGEIPQSVQVS